MSSEALARMKIDAQIEAQGRGMIDACVGRAPSSARSRYTWICSSVTVSGPLHSVDCETELPYRYDGFDRGKARSSGRLAVKSNHGLSFSVAAPSTRGSS